MQEMPQIHLAPGRRSGLAAPGLQASIGWQPVIGGIRSTLGQVVADPYDYSTVGTVNGRQGTTGEIPDQGIQEKQGEINA